MADSRSSLFETRASLDAHGSGMSSWKIVTFLGLLATLVSISKQGCSDYFNMSTWTVKELMESFPLVLATDPNDILECTVQRLCDEARRPCHLQHCFNDDSVATRRPLTCKNETSQNIPYFHLLCLVGKATPDLTVPEGCKYENVCNLYSKISPHDQTTTTAIQSTASAAAATTTTSAAVAVTANSSITTTATVAPVQGGAGKLNDGMKGPKDAADYLLPFIVSAIVNVLLLVVCGCLWWRTRPKMVPVDSTELEFLNVDEGLDTSHAATLA